MPSYKCDFCNGAITPVGSNSITLISYLPCFHAICQRCKANRFCPPSACPSCPGTQKNRVELVCHNCNGQPICVTCSAQHRHAGHNIAQIRQELPSRSQCMNHPNVQATYWCTCNARLCNNCVVQHAQTAPDVPGGHTRKSYTNCADVARQKLNTLKTAQQRDSVGLQKLVPILTHNRAMIRDMSTRARTAVAGEIVELCNALIRRGNDIVTAIDMVEDAKLKQYTRAEQDVKVAQDRLKKIEYFIDMACTTMQHDPPGVVSASIFAEGAYSHYNAKWQQMQQGLDVIQRKPSVCYFSDLPPILNSLQTLGQLEVDGVIKTPAPCTPQHARMFNVTNTAASTSRSVPRSNGAAPASGPAKGAGNRPPPLHPPNMPPNGYPGGPVLSPQFMHHAANVQQAASAQQYHMMAMQREAMMNHPGAMPPGYPGVPCSMHAHHPGQPALTIMTPNGPQLCCPPRFHPAQQAAMAAAAQNRGMPHAMIPNGPMVPNGVPRASGGQPILGRGPGSDGPGTPGSRSGNLHGATATAHIIESDRTAPLDARGQMISPHHTHLSNHSPAPLTCSPGSTPMPVRMARVRISAQSPQPSEEPTGTTQGGTTQGDRQVDREPAGEQNASASSAVMPDSTTVTTTRAEENASGVVQKERLQKRPSNDDSENGGIKEGEPAAKRPHTSGQDDEMEPQQRSECPKSTLDLEPNARPRIPKRNGPARTAPSRRPNATLSSKEFRPINLPSSKWARLGPKSSETPIESPKGRQPNFPNALGPKNPPTIRESTRFGMTCIWR
ncbi:Bromodomain containing protein [Ditylenchus destructor]|uniref:Bromodomain containing protein n=1 Tax=Ditylenchus destructor TaxID=166010 RepID=A0AAD4QUC5_9BILA|nr:Bromodomain containing protein [Ditylenchus destructor]